MSAPQFTRGPWTVFTQPYGSGSRHQIRSERRCLAQTYSFQSSDPRAKAQVKANAHLMAAAPRLYNALTQALGIIVEFGDLNGFRNMSDEELGRAVQAVAKEAGYALMEARGEQ